MKILAVDYGASRTGLAVCDPTEFLTTPITPQITLKARPKVAAEVCRIAQKQKAELIVVGLPLNMDGTEGERAEKSRKLGKTLQIWSGLPVRMWDERQSTCEAADRQRHGHPGGLPCLAQGAPRRNLNRNSTKPAFLMPRESRFCHFQLLLRLICLNADAVDGDRFRGLLVLIHGGLSDGVHHVHPLVHLAPPAV